MKKRNPVAAWLSVFLLAFPPVLLSCAVNPVTGSPEISTMSLEEEVEIGEQAFRGLQQQIGFSGSEDLTAYVQSIGARLADKSPRQDVTYTFNILNLEEPNALAYPGGYIYVSRGLLYLVNSEDELANVLGHEVGHVAAKHASSSSWRRTSVGILSGIGTLAGMILAGGLGAVGADLLTSVAGGSALSAHSRGQERQADEVGQTLAHDAGWEPGAMSEFLRSLGRDDTLRNKEVYKGSFLDTHPLTEERVTDTAAFASQLGTVPRPSDAASREEFLQRLVGLHIGQDPAAGVFEEDNTFLHGDLNFRVRFPDGWASRNAPSFVGAGETDGSVNITLELQGATDPKLSGADAGRRAYLDYFRQEKEREIAAKEAGERYNAPDIRQQKAGPRRLTDTRTGFGLEGRIQRGAGTVSMYWIPIGDKMFRLTCLMATQLRSQYIPECRRTARSLRRMKKSEVRRLESTTLQIERARAGEYLEDFNARVGNVWSVEQTATANGLELPYELTEGQLLKYARKEPYRPTVQQPEANENEVDGEDGPDVEEDGA